jgi:hypothetical protein
MTSFLNLPKTDDESSKDLLFYLNDYDDENDKPKFICFRIIGNLTNTIINSSITLLFH